MKDSLAVDDPSLNDLEDYERNNLCTLDKLRWTTGILPFGAIDMKDDNGDRPIDLTQGDAEDYDKLFGRVLLYQYICELGEYFLRTAIGQPDVRGCVFKENSAWRKSERWSRHLGFRDAITQLCEPPRSVLKSSQKAISTLPLKSY